MPSLSLLPSAAVPCCSLLRVCDVHSASRLRGNLASVEGVDSCQVTFSEGVVEVWSNSTQQVDVSKLVQAVKQTDDSYVVYVVSRDCFDAQEHQQPCPKTAAAAGHAGSSEEL